MRIIKDIIILMQEDDWYATSTDIEIAKGKNKLKKTWKEKWISLKRRINIRISFFRNKIYFNVNKEDNDNIKNYWKVYGIDKHMTFKKFRKAIVVYSLLRNIQVYQACEEVCKKLTIE